MSVGERVEAGPRGYEGLVRRRLVGVFIDPASPGFSTDLR
jgi:hypothetical protein